MSGNDPIGIPDPTIFHGPQAGLGNVGSYQVSGIPFCTGGLIPGGQEIKIEFPRVSKRIFVRSKAAAGNDLRIAFASSGSAGNVMANNHFITVPSSGTFDMSVKCTTVYVSAPIVSGSYELFAELTFIDRKQMLILTGTGITD